MLRKVLPLLGVSSLGILFLLMTGCGGSSGGGFASLNVSVHASTTTVDGAGTNSITLTATVTNDASNSGVAWTATAGTLSASTSASGAPVTFTPPAATSSAQSIAVTAISAADSSRSGKATITVPAMLTVTNSATTALNSSVGAVYSVQLQGSGGIPPYKNWQVKSGTLPSCLSLNSATGVIMFTSDSVEAACAAGSPYDPVFSFTDSGTPTALTGTTPDYIITITAAPALVLPSATVPAAGTAGAAYSGSVQGQGGAGTLTYGRTSGALPSGLTLDAHTGAITGTADKAGTYNFTVALSDAYGDTPASQNYSLIINPAPVAKLAVTGPASSTAGSGFSLTVIAEDAYGNTITGYGGTVSFSSTDQNAGVVMPASYTFMPTDNGKKIISGFKLATAGSQTVTAADGSGITGSAAVDVNAAALSQFGITASTNTPVAGAPFSVTVTAEDHYGNTITNYSGTVHFTSSETDSNVALPSDYTFQTGDSGVHPFTGVVLARVAANGQWIKAADSIVSSLKGAVTVNVVAAAASQLAFGQQPTNTAAGNAIAPAVTVQVLDQYGNQTADTSSVTIAIGTNPGSGALNGTATVAAVGGVAAFSTLAINKVGTGYTLAASDGALTGAQSHTFNITPAAAAQLAFGVQPANTVAGVSIAPAVTVQVQDQYGNLTADTSSVTIAIGTNPGSGALNGTATVAAVGGVAAFSTLAINKVGTGYTLAASDGALTGAQSHIFNITPAAAAQLAFGVQPANTVAGVSIAPAVTVQVQDGYGNLETTINSVVTVGIGTGGAFSNASTTAVPAASGVATFSSLIPTAVGSFTLSASDGTLTGATSNHFTVSAGAPVTLAFIQQPTNTTAGSAIAPTVTVQIEDSYGNPETTNTSTVSMAISTGGVLANTSTLSAKAAGGLANFSNLVPTAAGSNFTLTASSPGLPSGSSNSFTVSPAATSSLSVVAPATVTTGAPFNFTVAAQDPYGNPTPGYMGTVSFTSTGSLSAPLSNYTFVPSDNGVHSFSATLMDAPGATDTISAADTSTATINGTSGDIAVDAGEPVSGNIFLNNFCGDSSSIDLSIFTLTLSNSSGTFTATTQSDGSFNLANIPSGTYTLTPSVTPVSGVTPPESQFYPASLSNVAVVNNSVGGLSFNVSLGYTVSGTVSNSTGASGPVYLQLLNNTCGEPGGTTIATSGSFTIQGVGPGNYNLNAWLDNLGYGQANASNPTANMGGLAVGTGPSITGLSGLQVALGAAGTVSLSGKTPSLGAISGLANAVVINFNPITNNSNGVEMPASYTMQWSASNEVNSGTGAFTSPAGSTTFAATGANGNGVWFLNPANVSGLNAGGSYYFQVQGVAGSSFSNWSSPSAQIALSAASADNTITGNVTWTGTATGPLYVGFYDMSSGAVWGQVVGSATSPPSSGVSYSVQVPSGNYGLFALVDNNNDGIIDAGDFTNINTNNGPPAVTISEGGGQPTIALPGANSGATVGTSYSQGIDLSGNSTSNYTLNFKISEGNELPIAVTLAGGPNLINPIDLEYCGNNCGKPEFDYSVQLNNGVMPNINDTYAFHVTYSGGSSEDITGTVTGWNGTSTLVGASSVATLASPTGTGNSNTPNFDWSYPTTNPGNLTYQFWVCCGNNNDYIWQIPTQNSKSNGFTNSEITPPLDWGVDPTNSGNTPTTSALWAGSGYTWAVNAIDSSGNEAQAWLNFATVESGSLTLPTPNPNTLPPAQANASYSGKIIVTGGYPPYGWQVDNLSDNLGSNSTSTDGSGNNQTLMIGGTPTNTTAPGSPISFNVTVTDSNGTSVGPITYTIAVENASPLNLPSSGTSTVLVNSPYATQLNASGGTSSYSFTVNNISIPTSGAATPIADNISVSNDSTSKLSFSGTPGTVENLTLNVTVTDADSAAFSQTYYLNVIAGPDGSNNSRLSGTYSCLTEGYKDGDKTRWASISNIVFNGDGTTNGGVWNMNGRDFASAMSGTLAATTAYTIGSDNNGLMTMNGTITSGGTFTNTYALALSPTGTTAQYVRMVETDDTGGSTSNQHSSGYCYQDTTAAFASSTLGGTSGNGFAFGTRGETGGGVPRAFVGRFTTDSAGNVSGGYVDGESVSKGADGGGWAGTATTTTGASLTGGSYGTTVDSYGRFTLALTGASGTTANFEGYIVDTNRMFLLETDAAGSNGLSAGDMRLQTGNTPSSGSGITGSAVVYGQGWEYTSSVTGYDSDVMQLGFSNGDSASVQGTVDEAYQDANGTYQGGSNNNALGQIVTFNLDSSNAGRATANVGDSLYFYFFDTNSAFYLDLASGYLERGWMENQTTSTFTNTAAAGDYMVGQLPQFALANSAVVGEVADTSAATDNVSGAMTQAGEGSFSYANPFDATYSWDSADNGTTYGGLLVGDPADLSCVVIAPTKSACTSQSTSEPYIMIFQQ